MASFDIACKTSHGEDYSGHHQNTCDDQIRFSACGSVRFGRSRPIRSLDSCDLFSVQKSNIGLMLDTQMLRRRPLRQYSTKSRHFWTPKTTKHHNIDATINDYSRTYCRRCHDANAAVFSDYAGHQLWIAKTQGKPQTRISDFHSAGTSLFERRG